MRLLVIIATAGLTRNLLSLVAFPGCARFLANLATQKAACPIASRRERAEASKTRVKALQHSSSCEIMLCHIKDGGRSKLA
eukprot:12660949-Heterocapsa_arctica.AAC.1